LPRCVERAPRIVVLVGMMGSGKTTVGRALAARLGVPFVDSDDVIVTRTGTTVAEIFARDGEAVFRRLESEALREALVAPRAAVLAAAGGVVLDPANRAALGAARRRGDAVVVWLRADPRTLAARVAPGDHRPLLAGDAAAALMRIDAERSALYAEIADVIIDTDGSEPDAVVDAAQAAIR